MNYILIDMSYFIFYRYYALIAWWKLAKPEEVLDIPFNNSEFVAKFKKTFVDKLKELPKKLKIKDATCICGKDCPRANIWRIANSDNYKANRVLDDTFLGGPFFEIAYNILNEMKMPILYHNRLEGDDCIALAVKHIRMRHTRDDVKDVAVKDYDIYIIASDMDYLQLVSNNTHIYNLKYKNLIDSKKWSGDPKKDLFCKIVMGDKTDNISSIFKKCGIKTAAKCYDEPEFFAKKMTDENAEPLFLKNQKLVDFEHIPSDLISEYREKNQAILDILG